MHVLSSSCSLEPWLVSELRKLLPSLLQKINFEMCHSWLHILLRFSCLNYMHMALDLLYRFHA